MACCICLESFDNKKKNIKVLRCNHMLHKLCYNEYYTFNVCNNGIVLCPLCRICIFDKHKTYWYILLQPLNTIIMYRIHIFVFYLVFISMMYEIHSYMSKLITYETITEMYIF